MYNKRKVGQPYQADLKLLSKQLLVSKEKARERLLHSVLQTEGRCWTEFYKYVTRRRGNTENNPAIKDRKGKLIRDKIEKTNSLDCYYASLFSCERNNPQIQSTESSKPFTISINIIRKRLSTIGRKNPVGPDGIPGEIF